MSSVSKLLYNFVACLFVFLSNFTAFAQTASQYGGKGDSAYTAKNYPLAIEYYTKQESLLPFSFQKKNVWYNMACCYALNGDKASAWKYLNKSLDAGYNNYPHLLKDTDLNTLHTDEQWKKFTSLNNNFQKRMRDPRNAEGRQAGAGMPGVNQRRNQERPRDTGSRGARQGWGRGGRPEGGGRGRR